MEDPELGVLLLLRGVDLGGAEHDVVRLACGLQERGHRVTVAAEGADFLRWSFLGDLPREEVPPPRFVVPLARYVMHLGALARARAIDVVNAHALAPTIGMALARPFVRRSPALVTTVHNVANPAHENLARRVLRRLPDDVIFVGHAARERLFPGPGRAIGHVVESGLREKVTVAPIDLRARFGVPDGARIVGYVGRLHHDKAVDQALDALASLDPRTWLVIVGDGPEDAALRARARALGIANRVVFAGWSDEVAAFLGGFHCLVFPSRHEALSVVLREAGLAGLCVVASDVPGNREIVAHGETGLLVPVGDVRALSGALATLLEDPTRARIMGDRARVVVRERYGFERWIDRTETIFRIAIARRRHAAVGPPGSGEDRLEP